MITSCPNCKKKFTVDDSTVGKQATCTECHQKFVVSPAEPPPLAEPVSPTAGSAPLRPAGGGQGGFKLGPLTLSPSTATVMLLAGFVLVLFSRGGDSLGNRGVARANARLQDAENEFENKWDRKLRDKPGDRGTLNQEKSKERESLEKGEWNDLAIAARSAGTKNVIWAYWREWLFVIGSIVLVIGLVFVGFLGTGPERIVCLMMLGIITFSIYIGGLAWLSSAFNSVVGGVQSVPRILR